MGKKRGIRGNKEGLGWIDMSKKVHRSKREEGGMEKMQEVNRNEWRGVSKEIIEGIQ